MKKIILSLSIIGIVSALAIGGTMAYFTTAKKVSGNVFAMGTVSLGETQNMPFTLNNLAPGGEAETDILRVQYTGTLPADLYFGVKAQYGADLKDILQYRIEKMKWESGTGWVTDGWVGGSGWKDVGGTEGPFAKWIKVKSNLAQNDWGNFKLYLKVKAGDEATFPLTLTGGDTVPNWNWYQGKSATNQIILYAVQAGSGYIPTTPPWEYE